jgi:hypothetical protein
MSTSQPTCPVCDSSSVEIFLQRKSVPVHQNLVIDNQDEARGITRGDLAMTCCHRCGFVFNASFEPDKLSYNAYYDNTQTHSQLFNDYVDGLIHYLIHEHSVHQCKIIEVGCGKGTFLRKLIQQAPSNTAIGFDPTYDGPDVILDGRVEFKKVFYGAEYAHMPADIIVCRHVIEHIKHPVEFLRTIRAALTSSPHAKIFFETPCVDWILRHQVIWDFFYEHCSIFTESSLTTAFEIAGFTVQNSRRVFEGQYLWIEASPAANSETKTIDYNPSSIRDMSHAFAAKDDILYKRWKTKIQELVTLGKVAVWGAGAKGVTFANLIDPDALFFDCIIDVNPHKQGKFLPGSGHQILSFQLAFDRGIRYAILMNPNYQDEIFHLLKESGIFSVELITQP